jgi:RimJ/RimL family protein N-acetyltransferase
MSGRLALEKSWLKRSSPSAEDFDLQPHLVGERVELRPLVPEDWESLYAVASDPLIWEQHPASDRYKEEVFRKFFDEALQSRGALVVLDPETQQIIGSSRYFGFNPQASEIEIGWTFLARSHWGGRYNGEVKRLMIDHAFKFVDNVFFLVGPLNQRSRKALEKIGATFSGKHEVGDVDGKMMDLVIYEIRKVDWRNR